MHSLRSAFRNRRPPSITGDEPEAVKQYALAADKFEKADRQLELELAREVEVARSRLVEWGRRVLPHYLVFASSGVRDSMLAELDRYPDELADWPVRNSAKRKTEQTLLLYLQRIAAKNDTFSAFGPSGWGRIDEKANHLRIAAHPDFSGREIFFERWVAQVLAEAITADADVWDELCPWLVRTGRIEGNKFVDVSSGASVVLSDAERLVVERSDGRTPVHALGSSAVVKELSAKGILSCRIEVPALEPHALETIVTDISMWRPGAPRERWVAVAQLLIDFADEFRRANEPRERAKILDQVRSRVEHFAGRRKTSQRSLYSASNPIGEECVRDCDFLIDWRLTQSLAIDAAPWIDLWRDSYAFIASRVAQGLRRVMEKAAPGPAAIPMPLFLRACEEARLPLSGPGLVALSVMAFQEIKAAARENLSAHAGSKEYSLTVDDCRVVRNKFDYAHFDEYTYPSADLQLAAKSLGAVADGDYEWIVSELHPPVALLHHGVYWGCPDKTTLNRAFARSAGNSPNFHFGFFAADFTAHTSVHLFDALPEHSYFVAPQRGDPQWQTIRPADAEVFVDTATGDVGLRVSDTGQYLGSFARNWIIPLGFHPFSFSLGRHTPRLRCGPVIVQREAWTITREDLPGDYSGISRQLVVAIERLRAAKNLPRYIYVRPTEQALRRSGAEGRDKDTKPVFIDLESYLFHEIFYRWLIKAGELEVTEMLPDPDHLLWQEPDGRRTFELRTLIVPRQSTA